MLQRGVWYPEEWQGNDKLSHHRLVPRLRTRADQQLAAEFAALNASRHKMVLISAEDLADLPGESIAYFKSLLGGAQARIIFYCRRWSELLPSGWQEMIKHGDTLTFPEFLSRHFVNCFGSHTINYAHTLGRYAQQFGLVNISLVSYSNIVDDNRDLLTNFCQNFLSWSDPPTPSHGRVNVSIDPVEIELIRALNGLHRSAGHEKSATMLHSYQRYRSKLDLTKVFETIKQDIAHFKINEGLGPLQNLHNELFRQYGAQLVEPRAGQQLFAPKLSEAPYARQDYLLAGESAALIHGLYRAIHDTSG